MAIEYERSGRGKSDILDMLLRAKADPNAADYSVDVQFDVTPLQLASFYGLFSVVCTLLRAGADVNGKASVYSGRTALEAAASFGGPDLVELLVANNPDPIKLKQDCARAARLAEIRRQFHIARCLRGRAQSLIEQIGRDEMDDHIDQLCNCQILRKEWFSRCNDCVDTYPIEKKWYATLT